MKKLILFLLVYSTTLFASQDICESHHQKHKGIRFQAGSFSSGRCYISISSNYFKMTYRSYLITNQGQMMIFNSFGNGPGSTHTGARVFHFFPYRKNQVTWRMTEDALEVTLSTGAVAKFELEDGILTDISTAHVDIDPDINRNNKGGVEVTPFDDIIMDSGFKMGGSPVWKLNRKSQFFDSLGGTCSLRNSELFEKKDDEVYLTVDTNKALYKLLEAKCPDIARP